VRFTVDNIHTSTHARAHVHTHTHTHTNLAPGTNWISVYIDSSFIRSTAPVSFNFLLC